MICHAFRAHQSRSEKQDLGILARANLVGQIRILASRPGEGRGWSADLEAYILEDDLLDVAADGGRGGDRLAEVELVERGGLPGVVEPHDHDLVLLGREHEKPHPGHPRPHPSPPSNLNLAGDRIYEGTERRLDRIRGGKEKEEGRCRRVTRRPYVSQPGCTEPRQTRGISLFCLFFWEEEKKWQDFLIKTP